MGTFNPRATQATAGHGSECSPGHGRLLFGADLADARLATADLREAEADGDTIWPLGVPWPRRDEQPIRISLWR